MALVLKDRVRETTTSVGTGAVTLAGPYSGFQAFSVIGSGNTTYYAISDPNTGDWEVGIGTYTASGNTLSRDTVLESTNSGALVVFAAGVKDVILTQPAERAVYIDGANVAAPGATVPNSLLANSSVTLGSTNVALGATATTITNLTLTGAAVNGTVGATTPASGAFTTLSASGGITGNLTGNVTGSVSGNAGSVTNGVYTIGDQTIAGVKTFSSNPVLSGGTANGVTYLNGSKVLTTGSALTFSGGNLGLAATVYGSDGLFRLFGTASNEVLQMGAYSASLAAFYSGTGVSQAWYANGSEQMRLTSTGLGIGTTTFASGSKLAVQTTGGKFDVRAAGVASVVLNSSGGMLYNAPTGNFHRFQINDVTLMELDSSGNLGLGVTPSAWASGWKVLQVGATASFSDNNQGDLYLGSNWRFDGTGDKYITNNYANLYRQENGAHSWLNAPSGTAGTAFTFTQAMTLDASGNLLIAATSGGSGRLRVSGSGDAFNAPYASPSAAYFWSSNSGDSNCVEIYQGRFNKTGLTMSNNNTGTVTQIAFFQTGTQRGSITTDNSTTAYNTSSDYRLKENIQPMTGALAKVAALKPVTYKWKANGSDGEGFIAHELAEVVPQAVTGEKDAVDAEGKPVYQGIDTSFLVATLTAAIQEQQAIINQLKADVAALKGA